MNILLCIDDTDSIESRGTGELAEIIAHEIENSGWGKCQTVTRHQLLLHEDVPYTSHNSSMCFEAEIEEKYLGNIITYAEDFLQHESQPEADPGLCIVLIDKLKERNKLVDYGYRAKREVITKEIAYSLASELGIHLSEHGGTGQGVIGALAGAGLRLSGNDGWFKGSHKIIASNNTIRISELRAYKDIDRVMSIEGDYLEDNDRLLIGEVVKTLLIKGEAVILAEKIGIKNNEVKWKTCSKQQLWDYEEMNHNV